MKSDQAVFTTSC